MSTNITKRLRGIWHAWHFQFALSLVFKVLCRNLCIACLHPLTRRYVSDLFSNDSWNRNFVHDTRSSSFH
ncbi:DUF3265 domain-containing protein [Vibrio parahaemolyticus]|nr:DUF3265 domain-containing protein [Vibrio parahaemolyticus]